MKRMKTAALLLAVVLALAACGEAQTAAEPTPGAAQTATGTPGNTDTPAPSAAAVQEAAAGGTVRVEIERNDETVYSDDGADELLRWYAERPRVTLPENTAAEERINAVLEEDDRFFTEGDGKTVGAGKAYYIDGAREEYAMRCEDGTKDAFVTHEMSRTVSVARGDGRVLSLIYLDYSYTGGVHGYGGLSAVSFDLRTGEKLRLEDLADDPEGFLTLCADRLWEESRSGENTALALDGYFPDYEDSLPGLLRDGNWYFSQSGVAVIANPYEIAPYAAGRIEFTLPYEWLRWQIREEYLPADTAASGTLDGEILSEAPAADCTVDDGTDGQGACVLFTARGTAEEVTLTRVVYAEYGDCFIDDGTLWYASRMDDGETLLLRTWIGDVFPTLKISWRQGSEREEHLIFQSGRDGSLVLLDTGNTEYLPLEISHRLPFAYDLDGDGETEIVDLVNTGLNGGTHWLLSVDGKTAGDGFAMDAELIALWLADLDGDGKTEILFSGDMGSDDYITCAWRGDDLTVIPFTGESRGEHSGAERTASADGRALFSVGALYLESWSYQLGTYAAVREYEYKNGEIAPAEREWRDFNGWSYLRNRTWLTVETPLPVITEDGGQMNLPEGTELLLLGTDGENAHFTTRDGQKGTVRLAFSRDEDGYLAGWTIDGRPEDEYFSMLPYVG